jgi:hypothetical protein
MKHASQLPACAGALAPAAQCRTCMIWLYRHTLSPLVGYNCRHLPTFRSMPTRRSNASACGAADG